MQNAEGDWHIGHHNKTHKGNAKCRSYDFCSPQKVASAESAGDSAYQDKCRRKKKTYMLEKIEKNLRCFVTEHISVGEERVEKYHTENAETTDFVNSVDSFF